MKVNLNTLHKPSDCVMVSAYQLRKEQALCIVKSVLRGIVSSITGCQIQPLLINHYFALIVIPKKKKVGL